jgi:hypothetical protein
MPPMEVVEMATGLPDESYFDDTGPAPPYAASLYYCAREECEEGKN